jgi:hypothetical protein
LTMSKISWAGVCVLLALFEPGDSLTMKTIC